MLTGAVASIGCQRKPRFADALEASVFVYAHAVEAHVGGGTFIMVWRTRKHRYTIKQIVDVELCS